MPTQDTRIAKIEADLAKLTIARSQEQTQEQTHEMEQKKGKAKLVSSTHVEDLMKRINKLEVTLKKQAPPTLPDIIDSATLGVQIAAQVAKFRVLGQIDSMKVDEAVDKLKAVMPQHNKENTVLMKQILVDNHIDPCPDTKGNVIFKENKQHTLDHANSVADMDLFDTQIASLKKKIKNVVMDNSQTTTEFYEQKRMFRELQKRVDCLEEETDPIDLDALDGKSSIKVGDII
jgi:polyhydroxyalkanoate synthesis regulator phasin